MSKEIFHRVKNLESPIPSPIPSPLSKKAFGKKKSNRARILSVH
jgi:hypothetical protein